MDTGLILANDQAAINGIRSVGAQQLILAPGNGFTGGHSWNQSAGGQPSSDFMFMLQDPLTIQLSTFTRSVSLIPLWILD